MYSTRHYYLIDVQYLGFRYSGWQNQPGQKTLESMLLKTLKFVLPNRSYKILGAGRTDAKVSALAMKFELFLEGEELKNLKEFKETFNRNLPPDIRATNIEKTTADFNIIQDAKDKEYVYLFSCGEKNHPFCAPFLANIIEPLDIDLMKEGATHFCGTHDFSVYTARLREGTQTVRTIESCLIKENDLIQASFFPENSYALHIKGVGFMRYQIRMIMGALIQLGRGELSLENIIASLRPNSGIEHTLVAPGSGLLLNRLDYR